MAKWISSNWRWLALNLAASAIMIDLLSQANRVNPFSSDFAPLVNSGRWAVRFLLVSLAITPLNTIFGWRGLIPLRKAAGLWAFGFGVLHFAYYVAGVGREWLNYPLPDYIAALGVVALVILSALAATSTRWAMKRLGKGWKRLHRSVYAAGILAFVHGLLEAITSKRVQIYDTQVKYEMALYLAQLAVLLAARIPFIRSALAGLRHHPALPGRRPVR